MEKKETTRFIVPVIFVVIIIISIVILVGLASANPDGFEWVLFDFVGVDEPESGFGGIWSFLGEGPLVDVFVGTLGILVVLMLGYVMFWKASRRTQKTN